MGTSSPVVAPGPVCPPRPRHRLHRRPHGAQPGAVTQEPVLQTRHDEHACALRVVDGDGRIVHEGQSAPARRSGQARGDPPEWRRCRRRGAAARGYGPEDRAARSRPGRLGPGPSPRAAGRKWAARRGDPVEHPGAHARKPRGVHRRGLLLRPAQKLVRKPLAEDGEAVVRRRRRPIVVANRQDLRSVRHAAGCLFTRGKLERRIGSGRTQDAGPHRFTPARSNDPPLRPDARDCQIADRVGLR